MSDIRRPTQQDFADNRDFCIVRVKVSSSELTAHVVTREARIEKNIWGELRINPHGTIEKIELGEFRFHYGRGVESAGYFIDYAEHEPALLADARSFLEVRRSRYIKRLNEQAANFAALSVTIDNSP